VSRPVSACGSTGWHRGAVSRLSAAIPHVASRRSTAPCPATSSSRADVVLGKAWDGVVKGCGWHGCRGSCGGWRPPQPVGSWVLETGPHGRCSTSTTWPWDWSERLRGKDCPMCAQEPGAGPSAAVSGGGAAPACRGDRSPGCACLACDGLSRAVHAGYTRRPQVAECSGRERSRRVIGNRRSSQRPGYFQAAFHEAGQSSSLPTSTSKVWVWPGPLRCPRRPARPRYGLGPGCLGVQPVQSAAPRQWAARVV
jgi:hypothetical protein